LDSIGLYRRGIEAQTVVMNGHGADFLKDPLEPFEATVSLCEKIRVSGGSMGLFCPKLEEKRSLKNKSTFVGRLTDAIQNSFERVLGQEKIEVFFLGTGSIQEALLYRRSNIDGGHFAQTRDSR
jgi:hypothetical protein